jgi:hypothetical protein
MLLCYYKQWRQQIASNQKKEDNIVMGFRQEKQEQTLRSYFHSWHRCLALEKQAR